MNWPNMKKLEKFENLLKILRVTRFQNGGCCCDLVFKITRELDVIGKNEPLRGPACHAVPRCATQCYAVARRVDVFPPEIFPVNTYVARRSPAWHAVARSAT